jgi:hypothetical protein
VTVDVTVVKVSWYTLLVKVGVGTCKQLQMLDCCALLSPLNCAGWPLLMGTLDILIELVLDVVFFEVVVLILFDVETGFDEVVAFLLLVTIVLRIVELGLVVLVVFLRLVLTFSVLVGFLIVAIICTLLVVLGFCVDITFLMLVVFMLVVFALDVFLLETTAFARSSKSRFLMLALAVAELDDKSANPVDDAELLTLTAVLFENKVPLVKVVAFDDG